MIYFDVETDGLQWPYHRAFMYQFGDDTGKVEWFEPTDREGIQAWFDRGAVEGIEAWNTKFDWHFAANDGFRLPPEDKWHDGMLRAHAINERRSVALKSVADEVLGPQSSELQKELKKWLSDERARRKKLVKDTGEELIEPTYADVPKDLMIPYAMEDIHLTRDVAKQYVPMIAASDDLQRIVDFEREDMGALWAAERRGFPVDEYGYRRLEVEVIENLETLEANAIALAGEGLDPEAALDFEFNPRSSQQLYRALKRRGADLQFVTGESMDAENLETVDDELAYAILAFRSEFKVLSTYVRPFINRHYDSSIRAWKEQFCAPDGRVHANYRQVGARTARMSCSDPNMQNQPRDDLRLRYNYRAEPGYKLVSADLSNIEMRIFAAYAGEGALLRTIREGGDLHTLTAESVGIRDRVRAGGFVETARQRGKVFNFSILYGGGVPTVRKQQRVKSDEAKRMIQRYHDAYPEVTRLQNRIEWSLAERGHIKSAWGRRFRMDPRDAYKATNYLVQGTAAEVLKEALIRLHKAGVPVVALVHDEIIAHVPESDAPEALHEIKKALVEHPRLTEKVPLEADGGIYDRWSDAKPLKDKDGKKYLFTPKWAGGEKRPVYWEGDQ